MAEVVPDKVGARDESKMGEDVEADGDAMEKTAMRGEAHSTHIHVETSIKTCLNVSTCFQLMLTISVVGVVITIGWYSGYSRGRALEKSQQESAVVKRIGIVQELASIKKNLSVREHELDLTKQEIANLRANVLAREAELIETRKKTSAKKDHRHRDDEALPDCSKRPCSQSGQDQWLLRQFPRGHRGFFLDIGAHDGFIISNTLRLEQLGWKGLCIEPIPNHFRDRTCELIRAVVSNVANKMVQFNDCTQFGTDGGDGGLSGISSLNSGHSASSFKWCKAEMFTTTTMRDVLANKKSIPMSIKVPAVVDFTSLDVEGAELLVLQGFPFEMYCSKFWVIEHNHMTAKKLAVRAFMEGKQCIVVSGPALDSTDDFFKCQCRS